MRAVSAHPDVLVITSRMWQTNAVALRAGPEAMLAIRNFGEKSLNELYDKLREKGYLKDREVAAPEPLEKQA